MSEQQRVGDIELLGFQTGLVRTNCYVLFHHAEREAIIIDPGDGATHQLRQLISEHRLQPRAVLLTHGHFDHMWSAQRFADRYSVPVHVHSGDRAMLRSPLRGVGPGVAQRLVGALCREPEQVVEIADGDHVHAAGVAVTVSHTPGHTPGSVSFRVGESGAPGVVFTGDTLFAGTVGRTDLGGGSGNHLLGSIITKLLPLDDRTVVLPGHGPQSTVGVERRSNPFLQP